MKKHYLSVKKLSLWMRLTKKWNALYYKVKTSANSINLNKLNTLSLTLGVKRKIVLTAMAGAVTLGAQAQITFDEVTERSQQTFIRPITHQKNSKIAFGDVDGDGDLDLIIAGRYENLKYYKKGVTGFVEQTGTDNPFDGISLKNPSPAFQDVDGDGDLDLIIGEYPANGVLYYEKEASGFVEKTGTDNPFENIETYYCAPSFVDVDGDGNLDIVIGANNRKIKYYNNSATGYVEKTGADNPFDGISIIAPEPNFIDIDGDGQLDLVSGEHDGKIHYYKKETTGYVKKTGLDNPFNHIDVGNSSDPLFIDIDGDNDLDLVSKSRLNTATIQYYKNIGTDYVEQLNFDNPFNGIDVGFNSNPSFTDLDNDGGQDLVLSELYGTHSFFSKTATSYIEKTGVNNPLDGISAGERPVPNYIDIDNDGDLDLVIGNNLGKIKYYTKSTSGYVEQTGVDNPFDHIDVGYRATPTFEDIDNDGDLDLVIGENLGEIKYYNNSPNGYVEKTGLDNPFDGLTTMLYDVKPVFADLDKDGDNDLVLGELYGTLLYYENENNIYTAQTGVDNPFDEIDIGDNSLPVFTDIDNDGDLDLFIGTKNGDVIEFTNNSIITGIFSPHRQEQLSIYPNPAKSIISIEEGQLEILDALGNQVLSTESTGTVDISNLESGIYFVAQNQKRAKLIIE